MDYRHGWAQNLSRMNDTRAQKLYFEYIIIDTTITKLRSS